MRKLLLAGALTALATPPLPAQETPPASAQGMVAESLDDFMANGKKPSRFVPAACRAMFERNDNGGNISAVILRCPQDTLFAGIRLSDTKLQGRAIPRNEWRSWGSSEPLYRITRKPS